MDKSTIYTVGVEEARVMAREKISKEIKENPQKYIKLLEQLNCISKEFRYDPTQTTLGILLGTRFSALADKTLSVEDLMDYLVTLFTALDLIFEANASIRILLNSGVEELQPDTLWHHLQKYSK